MGVLDGVREQLLPICISAHWTGRLGPEGGTRDIPSSGPVVENKLRLWVLRFQFRVLHNLLIRFHQPVLPITDTEPMTALLTSHKLGVRPVRQRVVARSHFLDLAHIDFVALVHPSRKTSVENTDLLVSERFEGVQAARGGEDADSVV